jgi:hypothetical protein
MQCIICPDGNDFNSVEHIVPESLGNTDYVLTKSLLCKECNAKFSKFESKALLKTFLGFERARLGVTSKKGKPAIGQINRIEWKADSSGKRNTVETDGLYSETDSFKEFIPIYDNKTNEVTAKLLLKIGFESIYESKSDLIEKFDFTKIKLYLGGKKNFIWPYVIPKSYVSKNFTDILNSKDALFKHLGQIDCRISFRVFDTKLLFRFKYGKFTGIICLNDNDIEWIEPMKSEKNSKLIVVPEKYEKLTNV